MHKDQRHYFLFLFGYTIGFATGCALTVAMSNTAATWLLGAIAVLLASATCSFYRRHKIAGARVWRRPVRLSSEYIDDLNAAKSWSGVIMHESTTLMPSETFAWNSFVAANRDLVNH